MRSLILLLLAFIGQNSFGQYQIDNSVKKEFDSLYKQQKIRQKKNYVRLFKSGVSFLTYLKEDTLNTTDFEPQFSDSTINAIIYATKEDTTYKQSWFECTGKFVGDTLFIFSHFGFFRGVEFGIKIFQNKTWGSYSEYEKNLFQYRYSLDDPPRNYIQVNAKIDNFILSDKPNINSKIFYGKASLTTEPFYEDDETFKTGYILKQYRINFLFSCDIEKEKK